MLVSIKRSRYLVRVIRALSVSNRSMSPSSERIRATPYAARAGYENAPEFPPGRFDVERVVVRVLDPGRAKWYAEQGLQTICPTQTAIELLEAAVRGQIRFEGVAG